MKYYNLYKKKFTCEKSVARLRPLVSGQFGILEPLQIAVILSLTSFNICVVSIPKVFREVTSLVTTVRLSADVLASKNIFKTDYYVFTYFRVYQFYGLKQNCIFLNIQVLGSAKVCIQVYRTLILC